MRDAARFDGHPLLQLQRLAQPLLAVLRSLIVEAVAGLVPQDLLGTANGGVKSFGVVAWHVEIFLGELQEHRRRT